MKKIYLLSLGCPRNLLDSEVLLGLLEKKDLKIVDNPEGSDVAIVNTCGFIEDAKQESIDIILRLCDLKKDGKIKKLVVAGCLSQRYPDDLAKDIDAIDGIFGTSDITKIPDLIEDLLTGRKINEVSSNPDFLYDQSYDRKILTSSHSVYLKIQEGCSNKCSYCVIPDLKGPRRSRSIDSVVKEAENLKKQHLIKEFIIIGQDTTSFGMEKGGKPLLADLLRKVSPIIKDGWIRLLYTHPAHFTDELIDVLAEADNICKYVDLPIQHINYRILNKMNRRVKKDGIVDLIERIRNKIEGVTMRSSVIVGFPGETEEEFQELIDFLKNVKFDRLGAFIYSKEEGTPAVGMKDQVPEHIKKERFDKVMELQQEISEENNRKYEGKTVKVLIDEKDPDDPKQFVGRAEMDAPEVDGVIYVKGKNLKIGDFVNVRITDTMEYDLIGEVV